MPETPIPAWAKPMDVKQIKKEIQEGRAIVAFIKSGALQNV